MRTSRSPGSRGHSSLRTRRCGRAVQVFARSAAVLLLFSPVAGLALQQWTWERYGFDTSTEDWLPCTNATMQAVTNVCQTTNVPSSFQIGAYCLQVDLDLRTNPVAKSQGRVQADMSAFFPHAVAHPMNLSNKAVYVIFRWPTNSPAAGTNRYRFFAADDSGRCQYFAWINVVSTNGSWIEGPWWMINATNGTVDPGYDPCRIRHIGFDVGTASTGSYRGPVFLESIRFDVPPGAYASPTSEWYSFTSDTEGFAYSTYDTTKACTNVRRAAAAPSNGTGCLEIDVHLDGTNSSYAAGEVSVDMQAYPPQDVSVPIDLKGKRVSARVYCPGGLLGPESNPNYMRLFCKDDAWKSFYGSLDHISATGYWVTISMTPDTNMPNHGWMDAGFNPSRIRMIGLSLAAGGGSTCKYDGKLYLDGLSFSATSTPIQVITNSQHPYDFEAEYQKAWWTWGANVEGWHAKAWTNTYYATNQGVAGSVALAAVAHFVTGVHEVVTNNGVVTTNYEVGAKGTFEIAYQPALNLSTKDHRKIQASLRFDPAPSVGNNFYVSINVFDKVTDQWYKKEWSLARSGWNLLQFDLDNTNDYAATSPPGPMDASAIGFITIQVYAGFPYDGTICLDNVLVGGRETGTNYARMGGAFVKPAGHKFTVGGTNFYICGANIEYLQTVPDAVVQECLDWAGSNHLQMVRTWACQEGRPYSFQPQRGVWNELMFEHLDRIIAEAGHRGLRLMLGLVDNWAHNGGVFQYVHWAKKEHPETINTNLNKEGVEYHDQFWSNAWCKAWYKEYVTRLLNRTNSITGQIYKDDPTIFAWEIVNEPRCESDFGGRTIHDWLHEMSDFVRTVDTNHMLSNGEEGGYVNTYDFADTIPWEIYPDNYYHYATYATGSSTCDLYGCGRGHGVDFISDNKSAATWVQWQDGLYTNRGPTNAAWRSGNSNINFCTARIYVDQKEYNVWRTNVVGADQRFEWINDHWYDAHETIGKPMILEEFGIHAIGWIFNGSYGQVQLQRTPEYTFLDRVNVYSQYYSHIERSGISGSFFWNFGYRGMWDDYFHLCEYVAPWFAGTTNSSATTITLSTNYVSQGTNGLKLEWNVPDTSHATAVFRCPTNEKWLLRVDNNSTNEPPTHGINRTKFFWDFYNPGAAVQVALTVRGGSPNAYLCKNAPTTLTTGWTHVMFDLSSGQWGWESNGWSNTTYLIYIPNSRSNVLEDIKEAGLEFTGLPVGAGAVYIDNIKIKRDDGFVVYADDPVNPVIKAHADWCGSRNAATNAANTRPVASNLWFAVDPSVPTPIRLAGADANGDFLSYRIIQRPTNGWVFGRPPDQLVYSPKLGKTGSDTFTYLVHDGKQDSYEAVVTVTRADFADLRYDFERDAGGWYANAKPWTAYGITSVVQSADRALHGTNSLKAGCDLSSASQHDYGDAEVNMEDTPPESVRAPLDLRGQPVRISVYCPPGSRGTNTHPNRIQVYAKDSDWKALWLNEADIVEGEWVTYTLIVATNTPGTFADAGFRADLIRALGVRIRWGGAGSDYHGPIYIDAARFPTMERSFMYGFTESTEGWTTEDWGGGHAILSWTNTMGNPGPGALVVTPLAGASYGKFYIKDWAQVENENCYYRPIYRARIWVPTNGPANVHHAILASLVMRSSSDSWQYGHQSQSFMLTPGQWNLVSWDMSSLPMSLLSDVDEWGLEIVWPNRDAWSGSILVDSIEQVGRAPSAAPAISGVTVSTNTVGRYQKVELTVGLNNVLGLNPYDPHMVDLRATFTSPSGKVWRVNGFYMEDAGDTYGQGTWRVRFAPNELGSWTYQATVSNDQGTNTGSSGSFTCVASDHHGWVRTSDDDGHYLEHEDDTPFLGIGYCRPWDGDDEGFFREAEEHGINMIHWWMAPWDTMLTVKPADPTEAWREKSSYDTYEQGRAAELDRVVGHAEKHNVKLVWTIWPHDAIRDFNHHKWRLNGSWAKAKDHKFSEPEWYLNAFSDLDDPPRNQKFFYDPVYQEYQSRLYRYIIARWGYSEAIGTWALVSEFFGTFANSLNCIRYQDPLYVTNKTALFGEDPYLNMDTNQCDGNDYTVPWLTYINRFFKTNDPFRHPTTASFATDEYWDQGMSIVDIGQIHVYADLYNWIIPPVTLGKYHHELHEDYDKPSFMGEIGTVEWKLYEPDYTRVTAWPGVCAGAAITPMMWTTPPFSWFGDAKMGPWLGIMSDEMKVLAQFMRDIPVTKLDLRPAQAQTLEPNEPPVTLVESFESGTNGWQLWGNGIRSGRVVNAHATHGTNAWRLNVNMDTYANMPDPASGIQKYDTQGLVYNWTSYWPHGTVKMDVYIPDFWHPTNNPDGFLLGINKDPRSILEVFTKDASNNVHWYSTTNEYGGGIREAGGWKKLTVGMLWNLELNLSYIPTEYEAAHIIGFKFKFGDVGILRGPIYVDNITAGRYAYNTLAMVSSNGQFAYGWIQDRRWTNTVAGNSGATLTLDGLAPGNYHVEWWDTLVGPRESANAGAPTGRLVAVAPNFQKDIAFKVRRIGAAGATVHDVAVASVQEYDGVVRNPRQMVEVMLENQGTASEIFNVVLADATAGLGIGTNTVTLSAGASVHTRFWWNCLSNPTNGIHVLTATAATVGGETDTADNTLSGRTMVYAQIPPWDPCDRLLRWAPDSNDSDARTLTVTTNHATEGSESFQIYHRSPSKYQAYIGFDQIYEDWSNRTAFVFDLYVADGSTNAQILLRSHTNWLWYWSETVRITNGWNRDLRFSFTNATWTQIHWDPVVTTNGQGKVETNSVAFTNYNATCGGREFMQQLYIKVAGYNTDGYVCVDNIRLDGWYTLRLGVANGADLFPNTWAEQSNYTAAAALWMSARYLAGDGFSQSQSQIYAATSHDPAHNHEITPSSAAIWLGANVPSGYYFSPRYRTSLTDALKETVYWMDYLPAGGLHAPVQIVSGTNWSYKVVRGFQASAKPYGSVYSAYTVHGLWLKDPRLGGLGYDVYATAQEMENAYLPSTSAGEYWFVCEPPPDAAEMSNALDRIDRDTLLFAAPEPNPALAAFLKSRFAAPGKAEKGGTVNPPPGFTNLWAVIPDALRGDAGFTSAWARATTTEYYEVNRNLADWYYLASGEERGPGSTAYLVKLSTNGAFQQATWVDRTQFYPYVPVEAAVWAATNDLSGVKPVLTQMLYSAYSSPSPFLPVWQVVMSQGVVRVTNDVGPFDAEVLGDLDGDGMSNGREIYAGMNPKSALSEFEIGGRPVVTSGMTKLVVSWPSVTNRTYSLYRGTNLVQQFPRIATDLRATPPMNSFTDAIPSAATIFYRVEVE